MMMTAKQTFTETFGVLRDLIRHGDLDRADRAAAWRALLNMGWTTSRAIEAAIVAACR